MNDVVKRLKDTLGSTELEVARAIYEEMGSNNEKMIKMKEISNKKLIHITTCSYVIKFLNVAGIIRKTGIGSKGTYVEILHREAFEEVIRDNEVQNE